MLPFIFVFWYLPRNESHSKTKCKFIVPAKTTMCTSKSGLVSKMEQKDFIFIFVEIKKFLSHYDWILFSRCLFVEKVLNQFYFCFNQSLKLSYNKVKLCIEKLGALNLHSGRRLMGSLWARPSLIPITK